MWTHMCIMCGPVLVSGYWILDTVCRFGSEKFPYLIVFERLPQDDKGRENPEHKKLAERRLFIENGI